MKLTGTACTTQQLLRHQMGRQRNWRRCGRQGEVEILPPWKPCGTLPTRVAWRRCGKPVPQRVVLEAWQTWKRCGKNLVSQKAWVAWKTYGTCQRRMKLP